MKLKILMIAALVAAFLMPAFAYAVYAVDDEPADPVEEEQVEPTEETEEVEEPEKGAFKFTVHVCDLSMFGAENKELGATYELKNAVGIQDALKYHEKKILEPAGYKVAVLEAGIKWIELHENEALVFAHPIKREIQVIHYLLDCNKHVDASFLEKIEVDFLADIDEEMAREVADVRIEKMNERGYLFVEAQVKDIKDLAPNIKVYDLEGNEVTPEPEMPTISLIYARSECFDGDKEEPEMTEPTEAKVDAANADYSLQQTLPATGEQDLVTLLMSATTLLGLGIFFAKKH